MKKLLVLLLSVVLVLGLSTSAFALTSYTDADGLSTVQEDAIYRLSALGVFGGYSDGTFLPDGTITRAEFAKVACEIAGLGDVSDVLKSTPSSFSDVAAGLWYTGYINVASSQGFINGYSDGTFKPNNTITMAEVITILMRIAGYNDNLAGPWPFDYIAEAGKQDVTDDVTFVSNTPATRADVAVMANNALDLVLVNWDSDTSDFEEDDDDTTVLEDSFAASIFDDAIFDNDPELDDAVDGWEFSDLDDNEIEMTFNAYDDADDEYDTDDLTYVMNEDCYFAGGHSLTDIGGMQADIIVNDDDEVIYVKIISTVAYSDDVTGSISDDNLEVDDDSQDVVNDDYEVPWYNTADFDESESGYAKVFYNDDGDVYAVTDLYATMDDDDDISGSDLVFGSAVYIADSYSDDELETLDDDSVDLEDYDVAAYKDGEFIDPTSIEQKDVVTVIPASGDADYLLLVSDLAEGTLTEGSDTDGDDIGYIELDDDTWYNFGYNDVYGVNDLTAYYNLDGGTDGDYEELGDCDDIDDAFDESVGIAAFRTHFDVAYLITVGGDGSSDDVYGIVTDFDYSSITDKLSSITILDQSGDEVSYDIDNDDDILTYDAGYSSSDVELGYYIECSVDDDGEIDDVGGIWDMDDLVSTDTYTLDVSGYKIKIDGTWYKFNEDTLFFELETKGTFDDSSDYYESGNFEDAALDSVDDVYDSDEIDVTCVIIASPESGSTLERVIFVNSDMSGGETFLSFVAKTYTNSTDSYVKFVDGTVAERKDSLDYEKNVLYSYEINDDEAIITEVYDLSDSTATTLDGPPADDDDLYWIDSDGDYSQTGLTVADALVEVLDIDGDILELGDSSDSYFFEITDSTIFYLVGDDGTADTDLADDNDLEEGQRLLAICDEDANLVYVVIFEDYTVLSGEAASVDADPTTIAYTELDGAVITLELDGAEFDSTISESSFDLVGEPTGLTIYDVNRIDDDEVEVTLDYAGGDITSDDEFTIMVDSSDLSVSYDLETNDITIAAPTIDADPTAIAATDLASGADVTLTLTHAEFDSDVEVSDFLITGVSLTINSATLNGDGTVTLNLSGTISSATSFTITAESTGTNAYDLTTNSISITV